MVLGIDEAGRGPAIGPLVLCGVALPIDQQAQLTELGVRDSKAFGSSPRAKRRRAELADRIRELATVNVEVAEAEEVDRWCYDGGLNRLEQHLAERLVRALPKPELIVADGATLFGPLRERWPQLRAENGADRNHPVVAAASVVAKAERDRRLELLLRPHEAAFGPISGGGYPNSATARFLRAHVEQHRSLPAGVRRSWSWPVVHELSALCDRPQVDRDARGT